LDLAKYGIRILQDPNNKNNLDPNAAGSEKVGSVPSLVNINKILIVHNFVNSNEQLLLAKGGACMTILFQH
jgi:hypothetical protein